MDQYLPQWVTHHVFACLLGLWLFSNAVSSLPTPTDGERWYKAIFTFLHATAGNGGRIIAVISPQVGRWIGVASDTGK